MNGSPVSILSLDQLSFSYQPDIPLVENLSLDFMPGRLIVLLGPNGSGKSTILHLLSGLLQPQRGSVCLGTQDLADLPPKNRAQKIALVPQLHTPPPGTLVYDSILMGRYPYRRGLGSLRCPPELWNHVVASLELSSLLPKALDTLSGGELQRIMIARALVQDPQYILLDEPGAHLDIHHQVLVMGVLKRLAQEGRGIVVVLHDLTTAMQVADEVILLGAGSAAQEDPGDSLPELVQGPPRRVMSEERLSRVYRSPIRVLSGGYGRTDIAAVDFFSYHEEQ